MQTRRRFKQTTFASRPPLGIHRRRARQGETMPEGADQYELQKKIRQAETAAKIETWANSPGLQPPK